MIRMLAQDTSLWSDDVWVVDSTPVGCGCSRETARRCGRGRLGRVRLLRQSLPVLLGPAAAPGLHLAGLPVMFALAGAKADERETLLGMLETARDVTAAHPGQVIIGDKNYFGRAFERNSLSVS